MRLRWLVNLTMVVWVWSATVATVPAQAPANASSARTSGDLEPRILRQATFNIPFSVDTLRNPLEVQLFVSTDAGQTWTLFERQKPTARFFQFRANGDGPIWFASRTIEAGRAPLGIDGRVPELYVIVDTTQPELSFTATAGAAGDVLTTWRMTDATLEPSSLKIEYQATPHDEWVPIAFERVLEKDPVASLQDDASWSGEFTWLPQTTARELTLRAEVSDRAGNKTVVTRKLSLNRNATAAVRGLPLASSSSTPTHSTVSPTAPAPGAGAPQSPGTTVTGPPPSQTSGTGEPLRQPGSTTQGVAWPADDQLSPTDAAIAAQGAAGGSIPLDPTSRLPASGQPAPAAPSLISRVPGNSPADSTSPAIPVAVGSTTPVAAQILPRETETGVLPTASPTPASNDASVPSPVSTGSVPASANVVSGQNPLSGSSFPYVASGPSSTNNTNTPFPNTPPPANQDLPSRHYGLPPGERPRMTKSKRFQLDYEVDAVAANGVREVELWGTSDDGRTWTIWQSDPDRQSPLDIEVQNDGIYGFRIVIVGNNGLAGSAPRNGDLADLWVGVDTTPPKIDFTAATYGQGEFAGQLEIRWTAQDSWMGDRPVTLLFSSQPSGPWTTIAAGLPNSGLYYWPIDPRIPEQVYLRLEFRDEAGNLAFEQLRDPISISGLTPKARIRAIRPLDNARRQPFRNPFVR